MKNLFFVMLWIFATGEIYGQAPDILWTKTFGGYYNDEGYYVQQTKDGGYIIAGYIDWLLPSHNPKKYLIKTNALGDTLWTKNFGDGIGTAVLQTVDEGYIILGSPLIKTDVNGNILWSKEIGGNCIQQTVDEGYIITGYVYSTATSSDVKLIKTDASGDTSWIKTYGGSGSDEGNFVRQTTDGGYIITGITDSYGAGEDDIWLIKTSETGDTMWTRTFGDMYWDEGNSVQQTNDGGYVVAGYIYSAENSYDVWLIKTDAFGDTLWTKTFGGTARDYGYAVQQTSDGGYIIAGETRTYGSSGDIWLIKTDESGNTLWMDNYGGISFEYFYSIDQTTDGGYVITGSTESFGAGKKDIWLVKIGPDPVFVGDNKKRLLKDFILKQNYPNPFNPSTKISYQIPNEGLVILMVYDVLGNNIETLVNDNKPAGTYEVEFDASNLSSGVYYYRIQAGDFIQTKKMILLK